MRLSWIAGADYNLMHVLTLKKKLTCVRYSYSYMVYSEQELSTLEIGDSIDHGQQF